MSSMETRMPHSTIRHRPIFTTAQVTPLVLRASQHHLPALSSPVISIATQEAREGDHMHWDVPFCLGMLITLVLLLFGHFVG